LLISFSQGQVQQPNAYPLFAVIWPCHSNTQMA